MVGFKACTRCGGDVHLKSDMYGEYKECLQCGFVVDIPNPRSNFVWSKGKMKSGRPRKAEVAKQDAARQRSNNFIADLKGVPIDRDAFFVSSATRVLLYNSGCYAGHWSVRMVDVSR